MSYGLLWSPSKVSSKGWELATLIFQSIASTLCSIRVLGELLPCLGSAEIKEFLLQRSQNNLSIFLSVAELKMAVKRLLMERGQGFHD